MPIRMFRCNCGGDIRPAGTRRLGALRFPQQPPTQAIAGVGALLSLGGNVVKRSASTLLQVADGEVILEGGGRHRQPVPLSAMTHEGVSKYVLHAQAGVCRHDEEASAYFRDGQRVAVFEPGVPAVDACERDPRNSRRCPVPDYLEADVWRLRP